MEDETHELELCRCDYCGAKRPAADLRLVKIWRNGRRVEITVCADEIARDGITCASAAQMSAEG
jgi:hypothetical protein